MRTHLLAGLFLSLSLATAACGGTQAETSPAQSALSVAPVGQTVRGPARWVADALSKVPLRVEQRAEVEKMFETAQKRHENVMGGHQTVMAQLADQVEKGTIDRKALEATMAEKKAAHDKVAAEDRADLVRLHALLSPEQRNQFVDAMQAQFREHRGHHGEGHEGGRKFGKAWGKGEGKAAEGPRGEDRPEGQPAHEGPHDGPHGGPMAHAGHMGGFGMMGMLRDANLDDAQKDKVKEIMRAEFGEPSDWMQKGKDFAGAMAERKAGLDSFRTEKFEVDKLMPSHAEGMHEMMGKMLNVAEKTTAILRPEQRKVIADKLRAPRLGAAHGGAQAPAQVAPAAPAAL